MMLPLQEKPEVVVEKIVRNKRKCVTIVKGLDMFGRFSLRLSFSHFWMWHSWSIYYLNCRHKVKWRFQEIGEEICQWRVRCESESHYPLLNELRGLCITLSCRTEGCGLITSIVFQGPTEKDQIDVQGDIMYDIVEFITDTWKSVSYIFGPL